MDSWDKHRKELMKLEQNLEKSLLYSYKGALNEIRGVLGFFYAKFSTKDVLTYQEMQRFNRQRELEMQILTIMEKLTGEKQSVIYESLFKQYEESYYRSAFNIEQQLGMSMNFATINEELIIQAVLMPIDKMTLIQRLQMHQGQIVNAIRNELSIGLIRGESYSQMANRIKGTFEGDAVKARRVARTESARVQNQAREVSRQHAHDKGVEMDVIWIATLDKRTRSSHQKMDHKKVKYGESFNVNGYYAKGPQDPSLPAKEVVNCRCTTITSVTGETPALRRARDYQDANYQQRLANCIDKYMAQGNTEKQAIKLAEKEIKPPSKVIKNMSYTEWKKALK